VSDGSLANTVAYTFGSRHLVIPGDSLRKISFRVKQSGRSGNRSWLEELSLDLLGGGSTEVPGQADPTHHSDGESREVGLPPTKPEKG
jgi:hypothetical protein